MSCGVGRRHSLDPALLWLRCRLAAVAPIPPAAWELPYAAGSAGSALKSKSKKKKGCKCNCKGLQGALYEIIDTLIVKLWENIKLSVDVGKHVLVT